MSLETNKKQTRPGGAPQKAKEQTGANFWTVQFGMSGSFPTHAELDEMFRGDHTGTFLATDGR